jgi:pyruvate,orthophosphate dikinase
MTDILSGHSDVCRLDYLVGTLATAYRGAVASLVARDFCMNDDGAVVILTATVLSMPEGDYEASLNRSGVELSRARLQKGHFDLRADSSRIASAPELQIDIIQTGRHVGTFLLKKERTDGIYVPAIELSQELADVDFSRLTAPLRDRAGLLQAAEEVVAQIHSTKRNWTAFSDKLSGLSIDLFWTIPEAFYGAFDIIARFLLLAAERAGSAEASKPVTNYFDLLSLPLAQESDVLRLRSAAETWVASLSRSPLDFSPQAEHALAVFRELHSRCPDANTREVMHLFITSLRSRVSGRMYLSQRATLSLENLIPTEGAEILSLFGEAGKDRMLRNLYDAEKWLDKGDPGRSLEEIAGINMDALDDRKSVNALFDVTENYLSPRTTDAFAGIINFLISAAPRLSLQAVEVMQSSIPRVFDKLTALGRPDICSSLLQRIEENGSPLTEQIMLDPRIARSVLSIGQGPLFGLYESELKKIIIPAARVQGISPETWAEIVSPLHLERLAKLMDLLMMGNERMEGLLVRVTANLAAGGVLIPDDRLFQRRISAYLNSPAMNYAFLLNYLLLERLPLYFNEVGATSRIRDYSTEIDSWGNDPVIYFLRKQIHVNASSHNVRLLEHILLSWVRNDLADLREVVPPEIYGQANPGLQKRYSAVIGRFFSQTGVLDAEGLHLDKLLSISDETIDAGLRQTDDDEEARRKAGLLCKLYKEIMRKYGLQNRDAAAGDAHAHLREAISSLSELKRIVLSPEKTEPRESLYFKRHIAFGIPSVLGTYHETKFDALSEMMRRAEEIPVLLEAVVSEVEQSGDADPATRIGQWTTSLTAGWEILKLFGMRNVLVDEFADILNDNKLSPGQTADVLRMWHKELTWMVTSLSRTFHGPITEIIGAFPRHDIPDRLAALDPSRPDFPDKAADVIMRDILSSIPGLVESDRLLGSLAMVLRPRASSEESEQERDEEPEGRSFYDIHAVPRQDAARLAPRLGGKAKNLIFLRERGVAIPAGVALTARHTADNLRYTDQTEFRSVLREAVRTIEQRTGTEFGGTDRPLFLSVRSGSYLSMPGVLFSLLYCGMNEATLQAFIRQTNNPDLGWDSYRRFIEHYGASVFGLDVDFFERVVRDYRNAHDRTAGKSRSTLSPRAIAGLYIERLGAMHLQIPHDVYEQLRQCIRAVYASWHGERARQFRSATGVSKHWGTSVMLMEMVSGNREGAGASMFYTRDPNTWERVVYGETLERACGDDLASGRKSGRPISRVQDPSGRQSVEELDPELHQAHLDLARTIEDAFGGLPQEVEATYERDEKGRPLLFLLQTRRMEQGEPSFEKFDELCRMESRVIGRGIGAAGGALSGVASFAATPDEAEATKIKYGSPVILIRETANTDDVPLMPAIGGMITAAGGVTSHAVVLAQRFGISAVVGCADMKVGRDGKGRPYALIGTALIQEGSAISIDGTTGLVFSGACFLTSFRRRS